MQTDSGEHRHSDSEWRIILYYCYVDIDGVDDHVDFHRQLCQDRDLQGRIRVSQEGINGVLSGTKRACHEYESLLRTELTRLVTPERWELDVKYCLLRTDLSVAAQLFDSLIVKATDSVVSLFEPHNSTQSDHPTKKRAKQTHRRRRRQEQRRELQRHKLGLDDPPAFQELAERVPSFPGGRHLSPREWNRKIRQAPVDDAVLLDCRNMYESNVGYFQAPGAPTVLTNTRKYSDLPQVLVQSKDRWVHKKQIFMYCTGGVRCEQASKLVQALVAREQQGNEERNVEVYQLHGGIQRYLEHFRNPQNPETPRMDPEGVTEEEQTSQPEPVEDSPDDGPCLYLGMNFVFDPRRTDPMLNAGTCVGKCCLCSSPHDDYDNGHAPSENQEARCVKCRILLLVCPPCRLKVQSWGQDPKEGLPKLYCGVDACSDYQATGANPVKIVAAVEIDDLPTK